MGKKFERGESGLYDFRAMKPGDYCEVREIYLVSALDNARRIARKLGTGRKYKKTKIGDYRYYITRIE